MSMKQFKMSTSLDCDKGNSACVFLSSKVLKLRFPLCVMLRYLMSMSDFVCVCLILFQFGQWIYAQFPQSRGSEVSGTSSFQISNNTQNNWPCCVQGHCWSQQMVLCSILSLPSSAPGTGEPENYLNFLVQFLR